MSQSNAKNQPPRFKDSKSREWVISPSLDFFNWILESTGIDLIPDGNDISAVMALPANRRKLSDVLWAAVCDRAEASGVDRKSFNAGLDGEALNDGWGALLDAIVFFTLPANRDEVRAAIEVQTSAMEQGAVAMAETLRSDETTQAISEAIEKLTQGMKDDLPRALGIGVTSSPEL